MTEPDDDLPLCIVCRGRRTGDAYELDEPELDALVRTHRARTAPRVMRRYGAVPICRPCFDATGFGLESPRPGEGPPPLVTLTRRTPQRSSQ
jgi:hypothetical protein